MKVLVEDVDDYDGSRLFLWVTERTGIPVDQLNFLLGQLAAVALASIFRTILHPSKAGATHRHVFGLLIGLILGCFCFGRLAIHLALLPTICYIVIRTTNPKVVQRWVLTISLTYLSCVHLRRQLYEYGSYKLDITGPLMVITQKVTSIAFSIHDGMAKNESELTTSQQYHSIKKVPTFLEFISYSLIFPTIMVGPLIYYRDYIDFINGHHFAISQGRSERELKETVVIEPSPVKEVCKKIIIALLYALIFLKLFPVFPIKRIKDSHFLESTSLIHKFLFLIATTTLVRFKYYFAWTLSDAICNNAGLGFNGYKEDGSAKWDKYSNVDVLGFELSTNLRGSIDAWNIGTNSWLRMIVYDRVKKYKTILTYLLSALWHGFYPGYYLTFLNGALFTFAARSVRKSLRNHFVNSEHKMFYDTMTFLATRLVMAYITFSFVLLEFWPSIRVYVHMYWCLHIFALMSVFVLPKLVPPNQPSTKKNTLTEALSHASFRNDVSRHHD